MKVRVKVLGILKKVLGAEELRIDLRDEGEIRLKDVIEAILERANSSRNILLDPELRDPRPNIIVLINGKEIGLLGGLEAPIKDGDEIVLIPVVHGG